MAVKLAYSAFHPVNKITPAVPVIITHCIFGHRGNWDHVGQKLADKIQSEVYTLDARNHGESPRIINCTFIDMANDLIKFIDDHGIKKCHLLGHSLGGLTSIALALTQPSRVKTLAVVDVSPIAAPKSMLAGHATFINAMRSVMKKLHSGLSLEMAREVCENELKQLEIPESMRRVMASSIRKVENNFICLTDLDILETRFEIDMYRFPKLNTTNNLPTIFIRGEKRSYLKKEHEPEILKLLPKAKFDYVNGASHQVQLDRPDNLIEIYSKFYQQNNNNSRL